MYDVSVDTGDSIFKQDCLHLFPSSFPDRDLDTYCTWVYIDGMLHLVVSKNLLSSFEEKYFRGKSGINPIKICMYVT